MVKGIKLIMYSPSMVHGDIAQFLSLPDGATEQQNACMMMAAVVCNVLHLLFIITSASSELWPSWQKLVWSGTQHKLP